MLFWVGAAVGFVVAIVLGVVALVAWALVISNDGSPWTNNEALHPPRGA